MRFLLPIFIVIPIIEMVLLIKVGQWLGVIPTVGLVLLTAVIGVSLLRKQGISTLLRANQKIEQGGLPAQEIVEGILLAFGGALLLMPGFFTDAIGFFCLLPFIRKPLVTYLLGRGMFAAAGAAANNAQFYQSSATFYSQSSGHGNSVDRDSDVIEGEFSRSDQDRLK